MTRIYEQARPAPAHLIIDGDYTDAEVGVLKSGKEADVSVVERARPDGSSCLLALKRYRPPEHRGFRNDLAYRAHRRIDGQVRDHGDRRARVAGRNVQKAMDQRSSFGQKALHHQWVSTEWSMLKTLWDAGAPVPYALEFQGDAILMEFVGDQDSGAPRLVHARVELADLPGLFDQVREGMRAFARAGIVHGDLSPYNVLAWEGSLWIIDLPQAVPYLLNGNATDFLHRDVMNMCAWFVRRGLEVDGETLFVDLVNELFEYRMEDLFHSHGT